MTVVNKLITIMHKHFIAYHAIKYLCVLTVEHILCTCTKCEHNRKQYFADSQLSLDIAFAKT